MVSATSPRGDGKRRSLSPRRRRMASRKRRTNNPMSKERIDAILRYADDMVACYENVLTPADRQELQEWESSAEFTKTDLWPGWSRHIGQSPCARRPQLVVRRRTA